MAVTRHVLPDGHGAAAAARRAVSTALASRADLDDLLLATSELVSNAVAHGAPPVELLLDTDPLGVRITVVSTHTSGQPSPREATREDSHGRGLAMVARLSRDWGWRVDEGRMHVWAAFDPPSHGGSGLT